MSGMCSTECGCLMMVMGDEMTPGLNDGWTKDQMIENYKQGGCTVSRYFWSRIESLAKIFLKIIKT